MNLLNLKNLYGNPARRTGFDRIALTFVWLVLLLYCALKTKFFEKVHPTVCIKHKPDYNKNRSNLNISIIISVNRTEDLKEYKHALTTVECYVRYRKYDFVILDFEKEDEISEFCPQDDFMFRRHCAVVYHMKTHPEIDYVLFIDSDIGVINPNHYIEEYIDPKVDLIFYDRYYDYEIASGSYIAKNSRYSRAFLSYWADYNFHLPESFHGTDNGAIHQVFMDKFTKHDICKSLWEESKNWDDLFVWEACVRHKLNSVQQDGMFDNNHVKIVKKLQKHWVRDGWLTSTRWSDNDFMFHAWKESKKGHSNRLFNSWINPFCQENFDINKCSSHQAIDNWSYKAYMKEPPEEIQEKLSKITKKVQEEYASAMNIALAKIYSYY